jgi:hypothetical protein
MKKFFVLAAISCLGISCATAPAPRQITNSFPVNAPFEATWTAVIESFAEMNLPIMNMEKASGLITTDWISFGGNNQWVRYCDCGKLGLNEERARRGKFNVFVKKADDASCEMKINAVFEVVVASALARNAPESIKTCVSTGNFEAEICKNIMEKIAK